MSTASVQLLNGDCWYPLPFSTASVSRYTDRSTCPCESRKSPPSTRSLSTTAVPVVLSVSSPTPRTCNEPLVTVESKITFPARKCTDASSAPVLLITVITPSKPFILKACPEPPISMVEPVPPGTREKQLTNMAGSAPANVIVPAANPQS